MVLFVIRWGLVVDRGLGLMMVWYVVDFDEKQSLKKIFGVCW